MACYFRAWGVKFDLETFVAQSKIAWDPVWKKGDTKRLRVRGHVERHEDSGVTLQVSDEADDITVQAHDATEFLKRHAEELRPLAAAEGIDRLVLDFGLTWRPNSAAQFARFPPELLKAAADLGCWLEVSFYSL